MSLTEDDKKWMFDTFATKADLERVETNLLTEFHKWASPMEARTNTNRALLRELDLEYEYLDQRLKKLEGHGPKQ